ncbi:MAG: hypothetical protein HOL51_28660 [Gemmatimonadetes bacterium]|nr:hypothetical protein [Gemmatimonadota bacterium]MDE0963878.1 hypothetical protein [Candidatus Latescibacterota bacterium]MBT5330095.1 hypothetical protein [Gemmatimonadota bacterium]MBT5449589.1 hypothetical protein [Gemmatimonadota bacterium]MBT5801831.1 hypothetical protein [Gemmatimonadota bacterium]
MPWVCGSGGSIYEDLITTDIARQIVEMLYAIDADFIPDPLQLTNAPPIAK